MMAMSEEHGAGQVALKLVGCAVLFMVFMYSLGVVVGASEALLEGRGGLSRVLKLTVALVTAAGCVWGVWHLKPWAGAGEPVSRRTRKANKLLLLSGVLGGLTGVALAISTNSVDDVFAVFSDSPMSPTIGIVAIASWLIAILLSLQWHRSVDEHEARAYEFGGLAGLYLYLFLAPAWWLAWRVGLVPPPEGMVIFLIVMAVWTAGWFWRRYR